MSTHQVFKTVDVLKLEVEGAWTSLPNIVPNPNGEYGAWGWRHKAASSTLTALSGPKFRYTRNSSVGSMSVSTDFLPLEPNWGPTASNRWVRGSIRRVGGTSGMQVSIQFYDKAGALMSATTLTATQTTNGTIALAAAQAPGLAKYAAISVLHNGTTSGHTIEFDNAILVTGTQTAVNAATLAVEAPWVNLISPATSIQIKREGLNLGTLSAVVRDSTLDPATANTIRKGKRVKASALSATTSTWETLFTGKVDTASVTYDLLHPTASKRARIELNAVDPANTLAGTPRPNGVATIAELPDVLDGAGVPWNVNGSVDPIFPVTSYAAVTSDASALTQVGLTRDTVIGYAWISRKGVLNAWDRGTIPTTVVTTLDEPIYTDLKVAFDPADLINDVTVKARALDLVTGETVETEYGPFRDDVSAQVWGKYHKDFIVQGTGWSASTAETFANSIIQQSSQPRVRVNGLRMPITDTAHVAPTRALLDLYDVVTVSNTAKGISQNLRPTSIVHTIEPEKWVMDLSFEETAGVAAPMLEDPRTVFRNTASLGPYENVTLGAGFANIGPANAGVRKSGADLVVMRGLVNATTTALAVNLLIGTLPAGYAPAHARRIAVQVVSSGGGDPAGVIEIRTDGTVRLVNGPATAGNVSALSLDLVYSRV